MFRPAMAICRAMVTKGKLVVANFVRDVLYIGTSLIQLTPTTFSFGRSQWPRGLRCRSAAARLLRLWVRNPQRARMSVACCQVEVSGTG